MYYLSKSDFTKYKSVATSLYLSEVQKEHHSYIIQQVQNYSNKLEGKRSFNIIECHDGSKFVCKINKLSHRNKRIRSTLGIKRRGSYDWSVAEVDSYLKLVDKDYIPTIRGYGYERGQSGLIKKVICITEFKENTCNLEEYIKFNPENIDKAVLLAFDLFDKHINEGLIHLDLWLGNVVVKKDLSRSWLIDLEYFKTNSSRSYYEKFGNSLASFYSHTLCSYIKLDEYINLLTIWYSAKEPNFCIQQLMEHLEIKLNPRMSRKEIMAYF